MKIAYFLLPCCVLSADPVEDVLSSCGGYGLQAESEEKYHGDHVCDREGFNEFQRKLRALDTHDRLNTDNQINQVPNQKTVHCPVEVEDLLRRGKELTAVGFDSVWIVENTSNEPVVLSFVDVDGMEYSALHTDITPPQNDPKAILLPNHWTALAGFEGHVFHARSYDAESGNLGPVVMQHRMGLIPVGAKFQDLVCPEDDPEPLVDDVREPEVRLPVFQRTPSVINRPCNTVDVGFRNMANCPLHAYYIRSQPDSCHEEFKFHLGKNTMPDDFFGQWDSPTKFEGSFVGHSFAFRSAADPQILVETVTIEPTRIIDCPLLKTRAQINKVTQVGNLVDVSLSLTNDGDIFPKQVQLDDKLLIDQRFVASIFNETFRANASLTSQIRIQHPSKRSGTELKVGVNSF